MAKEVQIYHSNSELPEFISRNDDNKLQVVNPVEGQAGPYDYVYDFGWSQERLRVTVPPEERIIENTKTLIWGQIKEPGIAASMAEVTRINRDKSPDNDRARLRYQSELYKVYQLMEPLIEEDLSGPTIFFPPKNGGDLVRAMFQELELISDPEQVVDYELKRVLGDDGRLMVGARLNSFPRGECQTICFIDDCAASIVSLWASADLGRNFYPQANRFIGIVAAGTQRGMVEMDQQLKKHFGFQYHVLFAGSPVAEMSKNYYLLRIPEEGFGRGVQSVGDMGKWARSLSTGLNSLAPWNRWR